VKIIKKKPAPKQFVTEELKNGPHAEANSTKMHFARQFDGNPP